MAKLRELLYLVVFALGPHHREAEVGTVKAGHHAKGVHKGKGRGDIVAHPLCRRGGEGHHGRTCGKRLDEVNDALVRRPKVVAPLTNAVSLVHGEKGRAAGGGGLDKARVVQALGCDVDQGEGPRRDAVQDFVLLGRIKGRVKAACRNAVLS